MDENPATGAEADHPLPFEDTSFAEGVAVAAPERSPSSFEGSSAAAALRAASGGRRTPSQRGSFEHLADLSAFPGDGQSRSGSRSGASPSPGPSQRGPSPVPSGLPRATASPPPVPPLLSIDITGLQSLIYNLQTEHVEMKAIVNKFSAGLGQLDHMNAHLERMAAEMGQLRMMGGTGGQGGMPKGMAAQWEGLVQQVGQNTQVMKETYKQRAEMQLQFSSLQAQVQAMREGEGWKDQLDALAEASSAHAKQITEIDERVATLEAKLAGLHEDHTNLKQAYDEFSDTSSRTLSTLQADYQESQGGNDASFKTLSQVTREMKDNIYHHQQELKSMREAAVVACNAQMASVDLIKGDLKMVQLRLEPASNEEKRMTTAMEFYNKTVEATELDEANVWEQMQKRSTAMAQLCLATAGGVAVCGKQNSGLGDKAVKKMEAMMDKLKIDLETVEESVNNADRKTTLHNGRISTLEEDMRKVQVMGYGGENQVVTHAQLEDIMEKMDAKGAHQLNQAIARLDELSGQAEMLAANKMDRVDSISRQYLEKSIGEISMEFAAALQRHRQELNRYLNDKAQADVLMDMEGRFGQRLQQMEAILMKGVKGLDERASQALARKADFALVQRLQDKLEMMLLASAENRRATSPSAAGIRGQSCLSCNQPVLSAHDQYVQREQFGVKFTDPSGNLPAPAPFHTSFGGMVTGDLKGASFNARLNTPNRGSRLNTPARGSTPAARYRGQNAKPEGLGDNELVRGEGGGGKDFGGGEFGGGGRPVSKQGPRNGSSGLVVTQRLSSSSGSVGEDPGFSPRPGSPSLPAVGP